MSGPTIHFPTKEEEEALLKAALARMHSVNHERCMEAINGVQALARLMTMLKDNHDTGQPYKLRRLLYSLWNGKPADLTDTLCLDWQLKRDFTRVLLGFGYEGKEVKLFYKAIETAFRDAGLWEWFLEEADERPTK